MDKFEDLLREYESDDIKIYDEDIKRVTKKTNEALKKEDDDLKVKMFVIDIVKSMTDNDIKISEISDMFFYDEFWNERLKEIEKIRDISTLKIKKDTILLVDFIKERHDNIVKKGLDYISPAKDIKEAFKNYL